MDPMPGHFIPPLLMSVPTGQVTFAYVGADIEWQSEQNASPIRCAKNGQLSVYGHQVGDFGRVVIGVSFEEDDLQILNRQTYYHYLEGEDTVHIGDFQVTFIFNNRPAVQRPGEEYKQTMAWRIQFAPGTLDTVRSLLEHINTSGSWRHLAPISSLPAEDQSVLYYSLRSALIEQPIPERLGVLGHWQSRLPGGTPSYMPYMGDRYHALNAEGKKQTIFEKEAEKYRVKKMAEEAQALLDMQVVRGAPEWHSTENASPQPDVSLLASPRSETAKITVQLDDGLDTQLRSTNPSKQPLNGQQQLKFGLLHSSSNSPKSTPKHATNGISARVYAQNGTSNTNGTKASFGKSNDTKASAGESNGRTSPHETIPATPDTTLPTHARVINTINGTTSTPVTKNGTTPSLFLSPSSPSVGGSPRLPVRIRGKGKAGLTDVAEQQQQQQQQSQMSERKISLNMIAHLRNGRTATVQLVVPDEDTAGQVWAAPQLLRPCEEHGLEIKPVSVMQEEVSSLEKAVSTLEKAISDFVEEEDGGRDKVGDDEQEEDTAVGVV